MSLAGVVVYEDDLDRPVRQAGELAPPRSQSA
jgi:hypothetical protein